MLADLRSADVPAVRIRSGRGYCSGVLIEPDGCAAAQASTRLVLTCAHHFRRPPMGGYRASGAGFVRQVTAVRTIDGTEMAVALLDAPAPPHDLLALCSRAPYPRAATATTGFGGVLAAAITRPGSYVLTVPVATSRDLRTVVKPAGVVFNRPATVKSDSGAPVVAEGGIVGVQSLILDPWGRNTGIAMISLTAGRLDAIRAAATDLVCRF